MEEKKNEKKIIRGAIYTRVSTEMQASEGESLDEQEQRLKNYCAMRDIKAYKVYREEGKSGKNLERPKFTEMIQDIVKGKIDVVVIKKVDRLSRSIIDFEKTFIFLEERNVRLISLHDNFDSSTAIGRAITRVVMVFAQLEREQTGERVADVMQFRASKGLWNGGTVPYGYTSINKKLVPDKKESEVVQDMFDTYINTGSLSAIYKKFKEKKIKNRKDELFTKSALAHILRNVIYAGKIKHNGDIYQGIHKPIISEDVFNIAKCQPKEKVKKYKVYRHHIFGGLTICDECDRHMTPSFINKQRKGKLKRYFYYRCTSTFKKDWDSCSIKQVNADKLKKGIIENLQRVVKDNQYLEAFTFKLNHDEKLKLKKAKNTLDPNPALILVQTIL